MINDEKAAFFRNYPMLPHFLLVYIREDLVPAGGVQLAYARKGARDDTGIAFVRGGLCLESVGFDTPQVGFGGGGMIATVLLTAMKFDPRIRSAAIIACTPAAVKTMDGRFLEICSFDPQPGTPRNKDNGLGCCPVLP